MAGDGRKTMPRERAAPPRGWLARGWLRMHRGDSAGWLILTALQALLAWVFIGLSRLSAGMPWEDQARWLVVVAILATWTMALRTIRVRLVELARFWRAASKVWLKGASRRGPPRVPASLRKGLAAIYVARSMLQLRLIAAGISLPVFFMPLFTAAVCVSLSWYRGVGDGSLLGLALLGSLVSAVVAVYFHWSILPAPAPAREGARCGHPLRRRSRA